MSAPLVIVHRDVRLLADAIAARLATRLVDAQAAQGTASVALTGGGVGAATLGALAASPARDAVDWRRLDVWWGDERFLPAGDPERNETQARAVLLHHVDVDPDRVHPMPADDGATEPELGAAAYAAELRAAARPEDHAAVPSLDVVLLGVGADGHVASLFPEHPAVHDDRAVIAVRGCPKPPAVRVTLGFTALNAAKEVWFVVAGEEKAAAVAMALGGAGRVQVPAAGVTGRQRTLWLLDRAAAAHLPANLARIASP
jgi:6-phosphogluconolactonase